MWGQGYILDTMYYGLFVLAGWFGDSSYGQVVDVYEGLLLLLQVERGNNMPSGSIYHYFYSGKSFKRHVR